MSILSLARPEIVALKAYSHASWDPAFDRLHANELPWRAETDRSLAGLNRYPEPHPLVLAKRLAELYGVAAGQLLPGRGSDESIDLLLRGFCRAGVDNVIICPPTFGMYAVAARIQGAAVREVPLNAGNGFELDADAVLAACDAQTRIVFLCSPNNPTGNAMNPAAIEKLLLQLAGRALVAVDEAYIEFSADRSLAQDLARYPHLLAKVIPPYSIPQLTIESVLATLSSAQLAIQRERVAQVRVERERLRAALSTVRGVTRVWPSVANFLLVDFAAPEQVLAAARNAKLLIRDMRTVSPQSLRISVGTPEQNDRLIRSLS
jgi:histidinol-phosphate aminotransferase